jgi:WD40 repeat protein/tRNA A-37 threonylcarbamoyl transferase component Bud32
MVLSSATATGNPDPHDQETTHPSGRGDPPRHFGDYEIQGEIARGGMGIVYRARQVSLNRPVALKMILADQLAQASQVVRFYTEARAAARLDHPHIVPIHEIGEEDGRHFFSMKLMEGGSLSEHIAGRPGLAENHRAATWMAKVSHAVHFAHQHGILHRDLKPSNILLDAAGEPHVADFGLARIAEDATDVTRTNTLLGSPAYMAPEQAAEGARALTTAADVHSLGAILYELLTGRPPFLGTTPLETLRQVAEREPEDPRRLNPRIHDDLAAICLKCLEKDPSRRYAGADELADELDRFLAGQPIRARTPGQLEKVRRWCRRQPALAALVGSVALLLMALTIGVIVAAWWIELARRAEREERSKALVANAGLEHANSLLAETVTSLEWQRAEELFRSGDAGRGLAHFAALLRRAPANRLAAERILSALLHRNWVVPDGRPLPHPGQVYSVAFSPDGRHLVTGCGDHHARVWDVRSRREVLRIEHPEDVRDACFSPDGTRIAAACADSIVRIWDWQTGELLVGPLRHERWAFGVSFSPDGERIVTASGDRTARVWSARTGALLLTLAGHTDQVWQAVFSPDGRLVATASHDRSARLWEARTGEARGPVLRHGAKVLGVAFSPDGTRVASSSRDQSAVISNVETGTPVLPTLRHAGGLNSIQFDPNGRILVTSGFDNSARLWDARSGEPCSQLFRHQEQINQAAFSPRDHLLATAGDDWIVRCWDTRPSVALQEPMRHAGAVRWSEFNPDGTRAATAAEDRTARVWDALTGLPLTEPLRHSDTVRSVRFSPDGRFVVTASADHSAWVWEVRTGERVRGPFRHAGELWSASFSPDGRRLVTASGDHTARVWEVDSPEPLTPALQHKGEVFMARFSPDGTRIVTASADHTARVWNADNGAPMTPSLRHGDKVRDAHFSPDGLHVATASMDNTGRIWDARDGSPVGRVLQHLRTVETIAFSPDGRRLVTASLDHTARIWDATTGGPVTPPLTHDEGVTFADFSPAGDRVVTASTDHTARAWDVRTGLPLSDPLAHKAPVGMARFSPDGERVVTATLAPDSAARVWQVPAAPAGVADWLPALAEAVAGLALGEQGTSRLVSEAEFHQIAERLRAGAGTDGVSRVARWFLADRTARTISPFDATTTREYIQRRIDENTASSLEQAVRLDPTNAVALARLARAALPSDPTQAPGEALDAAHLARRALRFAPDFSEARDVLERASR